MKYHSLILMASAITTVLAVPVAGPVAGNAVMLPDCNQNDTGKCVVERDSDLGGPTCYKHTCTEAELAAGLVPRQGFIGAETHHHSGAEVEKRQGFIGAETHQQHGGEVEKRDRHPDCGSPFSPPCPPVNRDAADNIDTTNHHGCQWCGSWNQPSCPPNCDQRKAGNPHNGNEVDVEKRQGFIGAETHQHHGGEAEKRDRHPDCGSPFSPPCPPS